MFAIFKKEISIYFLTPFGYVFIGLFLLMSSIIFVFYNLFGGKNDLYGMFGVLNFLMIVLFPVLTMRLLTEEKRNSTDQLLLTSSVTFFSILFGKYLAALFVFLVTLFLTTVFAFFVFFFGNISPGSIAGSYLAFILLGTAYLAVSFFAASLAENQITSVILSFGFLAGFLLIGLLANVIPIAIIKEILQWLAIINKYDDIGAGVLKIGPLIYYLSFTLFFIFLTVTIYDYKQKRSGQKSKLTIYQVNLFIKLILILGILVILNLIADQFTWTYDMTVDKMFTLSEQSKAVAGNLKKPVNILVFSQENKKEPLVNLLLEEYNKAGKGKIKIEKWDAEKNPAIIKKYDLHNEGISNGNIIIKCDERIKRIHDFDIIKPNNFGIGKLFDGESQITSGLLFVTSEKFQNVYFLEGHDETNLNEKLFKLKTKLENEIHYIKPLNLLKHITFPDDMNALIVISPKRDLSDNEKLKFEQYLDKGGRVMYLFDILSPGTKMSNFYNLLNKYGVSLNNNFVVEEDPDQYYSNNKMYVIPDFNSSVITDKLISKNLFVMLPFPGHIEISKAINENISIKPLLKSSDKSWIRYNLMDATPGKGENDGAGPANLAVSVTKHNADEKNKDTKIIIIYNAKFITDELIDLQGNYDFFMNSLSWLEDNETSISIRPKIMGANIMMVKGVKYIGLIIVIIFLIPLLVFFAGFIVWKKRKHL